MPANTAQMPKYAPPAAVPIADRRWPSRVLQRTPIWCSVDLRDGNQALPNPMTPERKLDYFRLLCDIGFRHVEVSFPSASRDDFDFTRRLIEGGHVPDGVWLMVLSQCRPHLVARTMDSLHGARRAIVHLYCASSDLHREQVLGVTRRGWIDMVLDSVRQVRDAAASIPGADVRFEFSPEEFTDSDLGFVVEACTAVTEAWGRATPDAPIILNLPASVERRPPNQYADMIEAFCRAFPARDRACISLHAHNDQGMAVAATEMALLAGADRVEGTLFGHGERSGNVDLVTLACNLMARGIDTGLDFSDLPGLVRTVERLTGLPVYYRQPYSGEYAFTAFSGSHQDAIRKGMRCRDESARRFGVGWKVPYLHVDPGDLGCRYEAIIRINSQSGKGGCAWVLQQECGLDLPRPMHPDLGAAVQRISDGLAREVTAAEVYQAFTDEFVTPAGPYELVGYWPRPDERDPGHVHGEVRLRVDGVERAATAEGNGPISAFVHGLRAAGLPEFSVQDYDEQALGRGEDARAVAYVPIRFGAGRASYGVGIDTNIDQAAVRAIVAALNRASRAPDSDP
jgi:2-isopropylmalate synthase